MGNNPAFHVPLWQMSRRCPGIVVLHDLRLQHFFAYLHKYVWHDRAGYLATMERYYGAEGRLAAEKFWNGETTVEELLGPFPLTPFGLDNSLGAFVHTRQGFDFLKKERLAPAGFAPLPSRA